MYIAIIWVFGDFGNYSIYMVKSLSEILLNIKQQHLGMVVENRINSQISAEIISGRRKSNDPQFQILNFVFIV